jgi:hypothetical protein
MPDVTIDYIADELRREEDQRPPRAPVTSPPSDEEASKTALQAIQLQKDEPGSLPTLETHKAQAAPPASPPAQSGGTPFIPVHHNRTGYGTYEQPPEHKQPPPAHRPPPSHAPTKAKHPNRSSMRHAETPQYHNDTPLAGAGGRDAGAQTPQANSHEFDIGLVHYKATLQSNGEVNLHFKTGHQEGEVPQVKDARSLGQFMGQAGGANATKAAEVGDKLGIKDQVAAAHAAAQKAAFNNGANVG